MTFRIRLTREAEADLERFFDFVLQRELERTSGSIELANRHSQPSGRELRHFNVGSTEVIVCAVRHQLEDDYHRAELSRAAARQRRARHLPGRRHTASLRGLAAQLLSTHRRAAFRGLARPEISALRRRALAAAALLVSDPFGNEGSYFATGFVPQLTLAPDVPSAYAARKRVVRFFHRSL